MNASTTRWAAPGVLAEAGYVLLLPVVLFFAYQVSPINQVGFLDPWKYAGFINNFEDLVARYGLTYYSVRFGLIAPHLVLAKVFGPIAGYLAFCYLMYLLAGIPFYLLFRRRYSVAAAIFAYALLVSSVWFARSALWTHPDAAAVPYMVAATSLLLLDPNNRAAAFLAIGALIALAANCNAYTLSISGLNAVGYLVLHQGELRRRLPRDLSWAATGFILVFGAGAIGYYLCCGSPNFLRPTLDIIKWGLSGAAEIYRKPYADIFRIFHYAYLPPFLAVAILLAVRLRAKEDRVFLAAAAYFVASCLFVAWWQFGSKGLVLELFYYFCYLIPPFVICAALVPILLANACTPPAGARVLALSTAAALLVPLLHAHGLIDLTILTLPLYFLVTGLSLALIAASLWRRPLIVMAAGICFAVAFHLQWNIHYSLLGYRGTEGLDAYRVALKLMDAMPKFGADAKPILFWYPNRDRLFNSFQSTYLWGHSRLHPPDSADPGMTIVTEKELHKLWQSASQWLVLMDHTEDGILAGAKALAQKGVRLAKHRDEALCSGDVCVKLAVYDVAQPTEGMASDSTGGGPASWGASLFDAQGAPLISGMQRHGYGFRYRLQYELNRRFPAAFPAYQLVTSEGRDAFVFHPSDKLDHLATEFFPAVPAHQGGAAMFRLTLTPPTGVAPSKTCRVMVQNPDGTVLDTGCADGLGPGAAQHAVVFRTAQLPAKVRIMIQTQDGRDTSLPWSIRLEQARHPARH